MRVLATLASILCFIVLTFLTHNCELERSKKIKLYFSEISQIREDRKKEQKQPDELTVYLAELNDMCMKIFEAWVFAKRTWSYDPDKSFAWELDMLTNKTFKYHKKDLEDLFVDVVKNAKALQLKIKNVPLIIKDVSQLGFQAGKVWHESHVDHYRTEYYSVDVCSSDSKGRTSCHTEMRSRQVYDHTVHTYTYYPKHLNKTIELLDAYIPTTYDIPKLEDEVKPASKTNADGEYAVERTREKKDQKEYDVKNYKTFWITNSTYLKLIPSIRDDLSIVKLSRDFLYISGFTSKSDSYITYSHYDTPPSELTTVKNFANTCNRASGNLKIIWDSITFVIKQVPVLKKNVMAFIGKEVNYEKDRKVDLDADDILNLTGKIHHSNFIGAEEIYAYRLWIVLSIGLILFALTVFGIGKIFEVY